MYGIFFTRYKIKYLKCNSLTGGVAMQTELTEIQKKSKIAPSGTI